MMKISAIVAISENKAIGKDNQLPWHLPEDLKFFKRTTMGKPVLMGRKTYESLGKPLPGRLNIVLSRNNITLPEGVLLRHNLAEGINKLKESESEEVFIIGGGQIFAESMEIIDRLYVTEVHTTIEGASAFFPDVDHSHWKLVWEEKHEADEKHQYAYTFRQYERVTL